MNIIPVEPSELRYRREKALEVFADIHATAAVTTRNRLASELANWSEYGTGHTGLPFAAWLLGLPEGSLSAFEQLSVADCHTVLERLANCVDPFALVGQWMTPAPVMSIEQQGMELLS